MKQKAIRINDLVLFFLTFAYTIAVLAASTWQTCIFLLVLSWLQLQITGRIRWKFIGYFILFLLLPSISLFITSYLHLREGISGSQVMILGRAFDSYRLNMSLYLTVRAGVLSLLSFSFLTALEYDKLVYSLIQNLRFPVSWGYALLIAFNSIGNIRAEHQRIQEAALMRYNRKPLFNFYIIPILVSATRYSQQAAMSIQTRGLNEEKSFIIKAKMQICDILYLTVNLTGIVILQIIMF
ncbi:MAG: energy-coupling factor transporter transmembrane protein EcfT [Candidatus Cloacimonetes bacterium]|nr:energy-coupling factor transporter transmembrane protein EcfT [Candidatus Cloacimonadota bacterium]